MIDEFDLRYKPDGAVLSQYNLSRNYANVIIGPLGSGKTFASYGTIWDMMRQQPADERGIRHSEWCAVRNTYPELESTTIDDWLKFFPKELGKFRMGIPPSHEFELELPDETLVKFRMRFLSLDMDDAEKKLRGMQLTGLYANEIKELRESNVTMGLGRTGRSGLGKRGLINGQEYWYGMIGDTNAPDDDHWLYYKAEEDTPINWSFFKQPGGVIKNPQTLKWELNPLAENLGNLPVKYYWNQMQGANDDWIKVNLANEYGVYIDGRPVHPEYSDSIHSSAMVKYIPGLPVYAGVDWGNTPAAALFQEVNGGYQFFDEYCMHKSNATRLGIELKLHLAKEYGIQTGLKGTGDPSGIAEGQATHHVPFQVMNASGHLIVPAHTNSSHTRRKALNSCLTEIRWDGLPKFLVGKNVKTLRRGLGGRFHYKRMKVAGDAKYGDKPDKNFESHVCEGAEYGLMGRGEGIIVPVPSGATSRKSRRRGNWRG